VIYIVAGVDKTGKTTLCDGLANALNIPKFKSTYELFSDINLEEAIQHDWRFFIDVYNNLDNVDIIFDRSFICQWVYSLTLRADNVFKQYHSIPEYNQIFKEYVKQLDGRVKYIFCYRDEDWDIEDEIIESSSFKSLQNTYESFFLIFNITPIRCRFEDGIEYNLNKVIKEIK